MEVPPGAPTVLSAGPALPAAGACTQCRRRHAGSGSARRVTLVHDGAYIIAPSPHLPALPAPTAAGSFGEDSGGR